MIKYSPNCYREKAGCLCQATVLNYYFKADKIK